MEKRIRLGKKERELIDFLLKNNGSVWKSQILDRFTWASQYTNVIIKRLYRLEQKGIIEIKKEINPETGREKQKVYLKQ
jgi:hypothetical protein